MGKTSSRNRPLVEDGISKAKLRYAKKLHVFQVSNAFYSPFGDSQVTMLLSWGPGVVFQVCPWKYVAWTMQNCVAQLISGHGPDLALFFSFYWVVWCIFSVLFFQPDALPTAPKNKHSVIFKKGTPEAPLLSTWIVAKKECIHVHFINLKAIIKNKKTHVVIIVWLFLFLL